MAPKLDRNMELRKLPAETLSPLIDILSEDDSWETLMKRIPTDPHDLKSPPRFNEKHIKLIKHEAETNGSKKFAKILFDEWGCAGRQRPTLSALMNILISVNLYRAADEVAIILNEPFPPRPLFGPAAPVKLEVTQILNGSRTMGEESTAQMVSNRSQETNEEQRRETVPVHQIPNFYQFPPPPIPDLETLAPNSDTMDMDETESSTTESDSNVSHSRGPFVIASDILENSNLLHFDYEYLKRITNNFTSPIGRGGFGDVFVGYDEKYGHLAIKKARDSYVKHHLDYNKIFDTEVRSLSMLQHENIVPILGISSNGPACIVIQYIDGGSLTNKILEKVLTEDERLKIIAGIAEGLKYIHHSVKSQFVNDNSNKKYYFVHGDVKSDNILLTKDLVPKLCDFGLSRQITSSRIYTYHITGTNPYLAPESFRGTVTQKSDIYSFGVVLLQILTGHGPIVLTEEGQLDILTFIGKNCVNRDLSVFFDPSVNWTKAWKIVEIINLCLKQDKEDRPSMETICELLPTQ